jgi:hypothetical protein
VVHLVHLINNNQFNKTEALHNLIFLIWLDFRATRIRHWMRETLGLLSIVMYFKIILKVQGLCHNSRRLVLLITSSINFNRSPSVELVVGLQVRHLWLIHRVFKTLQWTIEGQQIFHQLEADWFKEDNRIFNIPAVLDHLHYNKLVYKVSNNFHKVTPCSSNRNCNSNSSSPLNNNFNIKATLKIFVLDKTQPWTSRIVMLMATLL